MVSGFAFIFPELCLSGTIPNGAISLKNLIFHAENRNFLSKIENFNVLLLTLGFSNLIILSLTK